MRRFGLIGKTLKHSFSKNYFTQKFVKDGLFNCSYKNYELSSLSMFRLLLKDPELEGLNVTIPYKTEILDYLEDANDTVRNIGACNCIKIINGRCYGFNTDAKAFGTSLGNRLKSQHVRALVLGSGGASRAVQHALKELKIDYSVVSRSGKGQQLRYTDLNRDNLKNYQIIVNTTPLGMYPNTEFPPLPYAAINENYLLFDLSYNPEKTRFLELGEEKGAMIMNGYEMLILQAEESWRIWNE